MKVVAILFAVVCGFVTADFARGQTWTLTGAGTNEWRGIASSADGTKLAAVADVGGIYLSTNLGAAWVTSSAPVEAWSSIASSADGTRLIAAANGPVYISTNSGGTWKSTGTSEDLGFLVASSEDASKLMAVPGSPSINISTNFGASWFTATNIAFADLWSGVTCSADGTKMAAVVSEDDAPVWVSTNSGLKWYPAASIIGQPGAGIACAADGSKLMVVTARFFYVSTNWGATWGYTNSTAPNIPEDGPMACSANGSKLIACGLNNFDTSTNSGVSWMANNVPSAQQTYFACSADGNELLAALNNYGIWILQTPPSPQLNASLSNGSLNLSWIVPSTNMVLEESPDLINWTLLTNAPSLNDANLQEQLAISATNSSGFFRLISQ
ncbi:MAG TPA: hypothetical protein VMF08_13510 [Candidatus Sulfotelmatobacter sp.]|nr:hypothetical protein [Candidatus Sulfotelmatobacter sp.]